MIFFLFYFHIIDQDQDIQLLNLANTFPIATPFVVNCNRILLLTWILVAFAQLAPLLIFTRTSEIAKNVPDEARGANSCSKTKATQAEKNIYIYINLYSQPWLLGNFHQKKARKAPLTLRPSIKLNKRIVYSCRNYVESVWEFKLKVNFSHT